MVRARINFPKLSITNGLDKPNISKIISIIAIAKELAQLSWVESKPKHLSR